MYCIAEVGHVLGTEQLVQFSLVIYLGINMEKLRS